MDVRGDVFILYSFVRKADNFVDTVPQQTDQFYEFWRKYRAALNGRLSGDTAIDSFVNLIRKKHFRIEWIDSFLKAMEMDLTKTYYETMEEIEKYMFGSAEVVGLMMARIMGLPEKSYECAQYLGRAMQYINFIRDIEEDLRLGRQYLPQSDIQECGLESLHAEHIRAHQSEFSEFIRIQIGHYEAWQNVAERGFGYIPKRYFIPIKTASDMYKWTAEQIRRNPLTVYERKIRPSTPYIVSRFLYSTLRYH